MNLFQFLQWVMSDFWRFCGFVIILAIVVQGLYAGLIALATLIRGRP